MIWMKLTIVALAASLCDSVADKHAESDLMYALERRDSLIFYLTDLNLQNPKKIFQIKHFEIDKMYLSKDAHGLIVYWSQKDSSVIWRYKVSTDKKKKLRLSKLNNTIFLGLGNNEEIYLYSPKFKNISVYDYETGEKQLELNGFENSNTDMHCFDVDPRDREQIYFAECSKNKYTGRVYDISEKAILKDYEQALPTCFDTWRITPDGQRAFAVKGREVYMAAHEDAPFTKTYTADEEIVGFAVGNNEFFYGNEGENQRSNIFKATSLEKGQPSKIEVKGNIKLLALYAPPKREYLIYAIENGEFLEFVKTDLDFRKSKNLLRVDTRGQILDKIDLGYSDNGDILYWSYVYNTFIGRLEVDNKTGKAVERYLNLDLGAFIGAGNNDKIYFYKSDNKTFTVYDLKNNKRELQLVIPGDTNMGCVNVNPLNRERVSFVECNNNGTNFAKMLDVKMKKVIDDEKHKQELPYCFHTCGVAPNDKTVYAVHSTAISMSTLERPSFVFYTHVYEDIQMAAGNNELFYIKKTGGNKIFKSTQRREKKEFVVKGIVKALVLHQD